VKAVAVVDSNQTALVAGLSGAAVGVFDLSGNVWEWVGDRYAQAPPAGVDVQGPASGSYRVDRGGGWSYVPQFARVADRYYDTPGDRNDYLGVRLLRTAP
jgi:formylglycine-generating enzyme required for sulfatase activity